MEDCRGYIEKCLSNGERIQYVYEEHCREAILEQLKEMSELSRMVDMQLVKEEEEDQVMLWVLPEDEVIEKGMYHYNKPDAELLVCAPPALMAVVLGEYGLAQKICELTPRKYENDIAFEVLQDRQGPHLDGGKYRFCEVCMLSADMGREETAYFREMGMFELLLYEERENSFFSKVCIHGDEKRSWKCLLKVMERVRNQDEVCESFQHFMMLLLWYAFLQEMDINNPDFWKGVYSVFSEAEQWEAVVDFMHRYMVVRGKIMKDIGAQERRILACIEEHFRHRDCLIADGYVEMYIKKIIELIDRWYGNIEIRQYLITYFVAVKRFGGNSIEGWREEMFDLFEMKDFTLIELAFQNHLLREEWLEEYIAYFIKQKKYTLILPYLIQKNWLFKENADENV